MAKKSVGFAFKVDFKDINKEMKIYGKELGIGVQQQLDSDNIEQKIVQNVSKRLSAKYPHAPHVPVGRIAKIKETLKKKNRVSNKPNGVSQGVATRTISVNVGHIKTLDQRTRISTLDRGSTRMRHFFPAKGNPKKRNSGSAASRFHLWRLLEIPKRASYPITPATRSFLAFTTQSNNTQWQYSVKVDWKSNVAPASKAYWFLTASREIYDEDKRQIKNSVLRGVRKVISQRTRFHR